MRYFNSFQLVLLFAAGPFLIEFTRLNEFYAHTVLFWALIASYVVGFGSLVNVVGDKIKD